MSVGTRQNRTCIDMSRGLNQSQRYDHESQNPTHLARRWARLRGRHRLNALYLFDTSHGILVQSPLLLFSTEPPLLLLLRRK